MKGACGYTSQASWQNLARSILRPRRWRWRCRPRRWRRTRRPSWKLDSSQPEILLGGDVFGSAEHGERHRQRHLDGTVSWAGQWIGRSSIFFVLFFTLTDPSVNLSPKLIFFLQSVKILSISWVTFLCSCFIIFIVLSVRSFYISTSSQRLNCFCFGNSDILSQYKRMETWIAFGDDSSIGNCKIA